jgi:predicted phage terminase large subunit-like protein
VLGDGTLTTPPLPSLVPPSLTLTDAERESLLEMESLLDEEATRLCEGPGGLRLYTQLIWPMLEPAQPFVPNWHLDAICDVCESASRGYIQDFVITVPPRHSKSITVAVSWPTWEWGPLNKAFTRWIFSSYAQSLSLRDSQKRRQVMASLWYRARWKDRFTIGGNRYTSDGQVKYANNHTGYMLATSVSGSNTGEGGDRIVVDDPINVKFAFSDTIRNATNNWWDAVMSTRRNNPRTSVRGIIMQRTHEDDVAGHWLAKLKEVLNVPGSGMVHLNLPSEYEGNRNFIDLGAGRTFEDPRRQVGELLNPARFGPRQIDEAKRDLTEYDYSAQHQQRPSPAEGGILKKIWWRWWAPPGHPMVGRYFSLGPGYPETLVVALPANLNRFTSWDMSFKDKAHNDACSGSAWGWEGVRTFLLDERHGRMGFDAASSAVLQFRQQYPGPVLIEDKANGPAILDHLRNTVPGLIAWDVGSQSKVERAYAAQPFCKAGNIYLPLPQIAGLWIETRMHEWAVFPNGTNDDRVDDTTQAINHRYGGVELKVEDMTINIDIGY